MLTPDQKLRLAALAPGYDIEQLRVLQIEGQVRPIRESDALALAEVKKADFPLVSADGTPSVLHVTAWLAHAGEPNLNGDAFVAEDLEAAAKQMQAPNLLVMDWNHSAVIPWGDLGPKAIGAWYATEYAFNPEARSGAGAHGIRAEGVVWAWLFPEQANIMLGEQSRNGKVAFSMAALPKRVEYARNDQGEYAVLREPVFFTLSALDKAPADPDCLGSATTTKPQAPLATTASATTVGGATSFTLQMTSNTGDNMGSWIWAPNTGGNDVKYWLYPPALRAATREDDMNQELETLRERVAALETEAAEAKVEQDALVQAEARVAALEIRLAEVESARDALAAELATAQEVLAQVTAVNAELTERLAAFEAAAAEAARVARVAARLEELPETLRLAHAARADEIRERVERSWSEMSDEQWEDHKTNHLLFAFAPKGGFVNRSMSEGGLLPTGGAPDSDLASRAKKIIK